MNHRLSCPCHPHPDHLYELETLLPPVMHLEAPPAGLQQVRQAVHVKHFSFFQFLLSLYKNFDSEIVKQAVHINHFHFIILGQNLARPALSSSSYLLI